MRHTVDFAKELANARRAGYSCSRGGGLARGMLDRCGITPCCEDSSRRSRIPLSIHVVAQPVAHALWTYSMQPPAERMAG